MLRGECRPRERTERKDLLGMLGESSLEASPETGLLRKVRGSLEEERKTGVRC